MKIFYALFSFALAAIPPSVQTGQVPFSIAISTQSDLMKAGSEILVEITLTNTSNHEIRVGKAPGNLPQAESEYSIEVRDSKGRVAPDTDYGRKVRQKKIWFYRSRDSHPPAGRVTEGRCPNNKTVRFEPRGSIHGPNLSSDSRAMG
jgi:hypothetical protein